jgi:hypothetical protein
MASILRKGYRHLQVLEENSGEVWMFEVHQAAASSG